MIHLILPTNIINKSGVLWPDSYVFKTPVSLSDVPWDCEI